MRYRRSELERIAEEFRIMAELPEHPPYDITGASKLVLPVEIVPISGLNLEKIGDCLEKRNWVGLAQKNEPTDRIFHGFILMEQGSALIFVNADDTDAEQQFTVAHEISHFLIDRQIPRREIQSRFGDRPKKFYGKEETMDLSDKVFALIKRINITQHSRRIEKEGDGSFRSWENFSSENEADILALELLAPRNKVIRETKAGQSNLFYSEFAERCEIVLEQRYRLPKNIAKQYAAYLAHSVTNGSSILGKLGYRRGESSGK